MPLFALYPSLYACAIRSTECESGQSHCASLRIDFSAVAEIRKNVALEHTSHAIKPGQTPGSLLFHGIFFTILPSPKLSAKIFQKF